MPTRVLKSDLLIFQGTKVQTATNQEVALQTVTSPCLILEGTPITAAALSYLIYKKFESAFAALAEDSSDPIKDTTLAVDFGKQSIMRLLQTEGCEGIRFARCAHPDFSSAEKESIVCIPLDKDAKPMVPYIKKTDLQNELNAQGNLTIVLGASPSLTGEEKGNGLTVGEFYHNYQAFVQNLDHFLEINYFSKTVNNI